VVKKTGSLFRVPLSHSISATFTAKAIIRGTRPTLTNLAIRKEMPDP